MMAEIPRDNFEARLDKAPLAARGFFESVIEHFEKRNSVKVHFTDTNGGDLRLAVPGEVLGQNRLRNFATMYWQTTKQVVMARTFLSPEELSFFGIVNGRETSKTEPLNSEVWMDAEVWRYGDLTFIRALEASHYAFLSKYENN
jgi:hypothetical protein